VRRGDYRARSRAFGAMLAATGLMVSGCGLLSGPRSLNEDAPQTIEVSSPEVVKGLLGAEFTCHSSHKPVTPPVSWSGAPTRTKSYALVIDDSDAPITPWVYWLVFDIGAATTYIQVGHAPARLPPGARVARNSTGQAAHDPPCPQGAPHKYRITVYALNTMLGRQLPSQPQLLPTWTAIAAHVIARGTMTVTACPTADVGQTPSCRPAPSNQRR
jgi:Raf kinase inhibitor-like YbhB/YbcL family protein